MLMVMARGAQFEEDRTQITPQIICCCPKSLSFCSAAPQHGAFQLCSSTLRADLVIQATEPFTTHPPTENAPSAAAGSMPPGQPIHTTAAPAYASSSILGLCSLDQRLPRHTPGIPGRHQRQGTGRSPVHAGGVGHSRVSTLLALHLTTPQQQRHTPCLPFNTSFPHNNRA
jgi:hypothetical protein